MSYRYLGNKARIADRVLDVIGKRLGSGATVADPMCGTASMSAAFKGHGFRVLASDLMTFAVQHAQVRLLLGEEPPFDGLGLRYPEALTELNSAPHVRGLFWREYSPAGTPRAGVPARMYFTPHNASKIDGIRTVLQSWAPRLTDLERSLLHHDLVLAANRVANIAGTYGHFRSTWSSTALKSVSLRATRFDGFIGENHEVRQGAVEALAPTISADACYLDPPYKKRQYAANYHILETLARGDEPEALGLSGLRDWWDQYSDFCSKRKIGDAFAAAIEPMECSLFFVSYSEDGLMSPEFMRETLSRFGCVTREEFSHQRFKSNSGGEGGNLMEHVYVVRR